MEYYWREFRKIRRMRLARKQPHQPAAASSSIRRVICRFDMIEAANTPSVTIAIMIVESALISWLTPNRTYE